MSRRIRYLVSLLIVAAMLLSACGGAAAPAPAAPAPATEAVAPTVAPTEAPTVEPTVAPTVAPTEAPAAAPAVEATEAPAEEPAAEATEAPAAEPAAEATEAPAEEPAAEAPVAAGDIIAVVDEYLSNIPEGYMSVGNVEAFKAILDTGAAVVIDVRETSEYEAGHVPGAISIPLRTVAQNLALVPTDKPVVVYCASGHRAAMVTSSLRILGYGNVRAFPGGWKAWSDAGEEVSMDAVAGESFDVPEIAPDVIAAVDGFLSGIPEGYYSLGTVEKLNDAVDAGAFLVDVREESEYAEGAILDAINIPIRTIAQHLDEIPTSGQVVVYCASGFRAALSLASLQIMGYTNVRSFPPGYGAWEASVQ